MSISLTEAQNEAAAQSAASGILALTEAWTPLKPHAVQSLLYHHPAKFKWCPAGRRSGKTTIALRKVCTNLLRIYNGMPARMVIGAPTYTRAKEIYFEPLRALIPSHWLKKIKESTQEIEFRTHWNATIRIAGMKMPQFVEGVPWNLGIFDELADYPPGCFERHILQAFGTEGVEQSAWMIGTPDEDGANQTEYEKYYEIGKRWPEQPDHCSFWWPATDIISAEKRESYIATMDEATYRQEVLGLFIRRGNRAIANFSDHIHVSDKYAEYSSFLPIDHTLDFGVRPAASLIAQHYGNQAWIIDEIILEDGDTDAAALAFIERCGELGIDLRQGLYVYGDAAGRSPHSSTGESDYERLREHYRQWSPSFRNLLTNPAIKDTVNAIRVKVADGRGFATLFIHPRCKRLIEELKSAPWPDKLESYHALAALRYYIYALFGYGAGRGGVTAITRADLATESQRISARHVRQNPIRER